LTYVGQGLATQQPPEQVRKVHPHAGAQAMPAPDPRVYVQQFELGITLVLFELDLCQACIPGGRKQAARDILDLWSLNRLYRGAEPPKLEWVLSSSSHCESRQNLALMTQGCIRELATAFTGDEFLDHNVRRIN